MVKNNQIFATLADEAAASNHGKRIAIFIVAYNAVTTLRSVLQRIPKTIYNNVEKIVVFDDASPDATYELAIGMKNTTGCDKLEILKHPVNLGYGGNQKAGYQYLIEHGYDTVILLHGDGQYAPEFLAQMYQPLVTGKADAVFGSRMMKDFGGPMKGGMPLYKFAGNRVLSVMANYVMGMNLTEWHSGYRAYDLHALKKIDFSDMTNDFHFDTQIIIKLHHQGFRIVERAIPTFYGDEICYVNGFKYAKNVAKALYRYKKTLASGAICAEYKEYYVHYPVKQSRQSSHELFLRLAGKNHTVLDVGCKEGFVAQKLSEAGNKVVGIDPLPEPKFKEAFSAYHSCSLDSGVKPLIPELRKTAYDFVFLMDVLEHMVQPETLLRDLHGLCQPNTRVILSVPNVANVTVRLPLLFGRFEYTSRGIMDRNHLKFWTRASIRKLARKCDFEVVQTQMTVMPVEVALGLSPKNPVAIFLNSVLRLVTWVFPGLFGYQTVLILRSKIPNSPK